MNELTTTPFPKSRAELIAACEEKMLSTLVVLENHFKVNLDIPTLVIEPRMGKNLGLAVLPNTIRLNRDAITLKYWDMMLHDTLPHEICHLVAIKIYNPRIHGDDKHEGWSHGEAWRHCMRVVGLPPNRCQAADKELSALVVVRHVERNYVYGCGCEKKLRYKTAIIHNRIQKGRQLYRCNICKEITRFLGMKLAA